MNEDTFLVRFTSFSIVVILALFNNSFIIIVISNMCTNIRLRGSTVGERSLPEDEPAIVICITCRLAMVRALNNLQLVGIV
jgi:hypothetical protein